MVGTGQCGTGAGLMDRVYEGRGETEAWGGGGGGGGLAPDSPAPSPPPPPPPSTNKTMKAPTYKDGHTFALADKPARTACIL